MDLIETEIATSPHADHIKHLGKLAPVRKGRDTPAVWGARRWPPLLCLHTLLFTRGASPWCAVAFGNAARAYLREMGPLSKTLQWNTWQQDQALSRFFANQEVYFRDSGDRLATIVDEMQTMQEKAKGLFQFYQTTQESQGNRVLYMLTLVTTIFVPAQFLTGLWGMNFEEMPELRLRYGYVMFWVLVVVLSIAVLVGFRAMGFWQLMQK